MIYRKSAALIVAMLVMVGTQVLISTTTHAANPADFNPGRIIDDEVFYNKDGMGSVADVQAFLNAHVPTCDTWGTQPSGYGNLTRAQYAQQIKGWPGPPYACLNNYHENPTTGATSFENGGGAFGGGISAAQIIYDAAQLYNINPKVLLVMLRKESLNLFSDSWPLKSQYKYAMGYACPDSGPGYSAACVDSKAGFYKQVTLAAWQLRYYYDHMGSYNYTPGRWNTILYNPDPGCGTKDVFIQNYATASLYIYTPYTPNDGALAAYPGTAPCGAYGNRNFWYFWQEWFGSTYAGVHITSPLRIEGKYGSTVFADTPVTVSFDMTNDSNSPVNVGGMAIAVRDSSGGNHDFPLKQITIPARTTITYTETRTFNQEDTYTFSLANFSGGTWKSDYPTMLNAIEPRSKTIALWNIPTLTQGLAITNGPLQTGKTHTINYTIRNNSASTQTLGSFGLAVRGPNNEQLDPMPASSVTLASGQSQTLSYSFKPATVGTYRFSIAAKLNDWVSDYPVAMPGIVSTITAVSAPRVVQTESVRMSSVDPRSNQTIPLTLKAKNNSEDSVSIGKLGLWGRDPQGRNIDPGVVPVTLAPGEERTIALAFRPPTTGVYTFGVLGTDGTTWNNGPALADTAVNRTLSASVKEGVVQTSSVTVNPAYIGQATAVTFKVKNYQDIPADLGKLGLWGRDPQGRNIDPGVVPVTLAPGEERTMNFATTPGLLGVYRYGMLQTLDGGQSWRDGPSTENNSQKSAAVTANPAVMTTRSPQSSVDIQHVHATETTTLSFVIKNQTTSSLSIGKLGLWGRDPQGRNIDPGVVPVTLAPGEERTMSFATKLSSVGSYSFGILATSDNGQTWTNGPDLASGQTNRLTFATMTSVTMTRALSAAPNQVNRGQCQTLSYIVKNHDTVNASNLGKLGLWGRDPQGRNIDPGVVPVTLAPGEERTMSFATCYGQLAGAYSFGVLQTPDGGTTWTNGPQKETDTLMSTLSVLVN